MTVTSETLEKLLLPFPEAHISWRPGRHNQTAGVAQALPFLGNRAVQVRLDEVVSPENWRNEFAEVASNGQFLAVRCVLYIRVNGEWVGKSDAAPVGRFDAHSPGQTEAQAFELAVKGAYSDAMKRAAVHWGIGRYLYTFASPWVQANERGRLMEVPKLPAHMLPADAPVRTAAPAVATGAPAKAVAVAPAAQAQAVKAPSKPSQSATAPTSPVAPAAPVVQAPTAPAPVAPPIAVAPAAVAAVHKPVQAESASPGAPSGVPDGLDPSQVALIKDLLGKRGKLPTPLLRSYIEGPKGTEKLTLEARTYLLAQLAIYEASAAVPA